MVKDDIAWQRREWRYQRLGLGLIWLVLIAAVAGVFGGGPLSNATAESPTGDLVVDFPRFARLYGQAGPLTLRLRGGRTGLVRVRFNSRYLEAMQIQGISVQPERVEVGGDEIVYTFRIRELPATITYSLQPQELGALHGEIAVGGGAPARFSEFIYP